MSLHGVPEQGTFMLCAQCREGAASPRNLKSRKEHAAQLKAQLKAPALEDFPSSSPLPLSWFSFTVITCRPVLARWPQHHASWVCKELHTVTKGGCWNLPPASCSHLPPLDHTLLPYGYPKEGGLP